MNGTGYRTFEMALGMLIRNSLDSGEVTFNEMRVALVHELEDMTFDECEACVDGIYFVCVDGECDPDGCERACDCGKFQE